MMLRDVVRTLNALDPNQKRAIDCPAQVSERMVSRRWNHLAHLVDASPTRSATGPNANTSPTRRGKSWPPGVRLGCNTSWAPCSPAPSPTTSPPAVRWPSMRPGCRRGLPTQEAHQRRHLHRPRRRVAGPRFHPVPHGNAANRRRFGAKAWYGYWMHSLVRIPTMTVRKTGAIEFSDTPLFIEALDVTSAGADMAVAGADLLDRHTHRQQQRAAGGFTTPAPGDIVMDQAYSHGYERFLEPARAAGYTPHFDLRADQRGLGGSVAGMLIVDGQPYSPAMPAHLHNITPPRIPAPPAPTSPRGARRWPPANRTRSRSAPSAPTAPSTCPARRHAISPRPAADANPTASCCPQPCPPSPRHR